MLERQLLIATHMQIWGLWGSSLNPISTSQFLSASNRNILTDPQLSDSWSIVTLAFFLRYPNPYASHVISCDVISRDQTPSGSLVTTRLILKQGAMPRWFPKGIVSRAESWVVEESEVDPHGKLVRCVTKNLDHIKVMQVEESIEFAQTIEGSVLLSKSFCATYSLLSTQENPATHTGKNCVQVWMGTHQKNREPWVITLQGPYATSIVISHDLPRWNILNICS